MTKIFIGSDHAGYRLKQAIIEASPSNYTLEDCGTNSEESTDYPLYAQQVCKNTLQEAGSIGVLICNTGIGMSIAANRNTGIRAALCRTQKNVKLSRKHNNANVLVLAAETITPHQAIEMIDEFLKTSFDAGRHLRRIQQIDNLK